MLHPEAHKFAQGAALRVALLYALGVVLIVLILHERWLLTLPVGFVVGWSVRDLYLYFQRWW
jgi:hypothetical protein